PVAPALPISTAASPPPSSATVMLSSGSSVHPTHPDSAATSSAPEAPSSTASVTETAVRPVAALLAMAVLARADNRVKTAEPVAAQFLPVPQGEVISQAAPPPAPIAAPMTDDASPSRSNRFVTPADFGRQASPAVPVAQAVSGAFALLRDPIFA